MENDKMTTTCTWALSDPLLQQYHATEWGRIPKDDNALAECFILESMQSGLSWLTVLRKRPAYRAAFLDFDLATIETELLPLEREPLVEHICQQFDVIKHKGKVAAALNNLALLIEVRKQTPLADFFWQFVDNQSIVNQWQTMTQIPAQTEQSVMMSKQLKKQGFKFIGPVTCYSFMQAVGMVNDHLVDCDCYQDHD
ncbi:DNA-3-methyladenine glycosylase I [Photobacterium damselae subsp. damselae]|uniref:DNA-3-methyladenine glycosylase I n=1 Tax=Photobacterium damselae TaxID=38293 RepID=UPI00083B7A1E|nr:DNA-3-methyladenine glycosylase I [Photobacterium damselae]QSH56815.1 DNA-3-methyladenine glycosylase I [Photobacterium damselae subsp. damselae]